MSKYDKLDLSFGKGAGSGDGKLLVLKPIEVDGVPFTADFDVTRNSVKQVKLNGVLTQVEADYPSMTPLHSGGCPILLTEPLANQLLGYTEDMTNAEWVKGNVALGGVIQDPREGNTMYPMEADSVSNVEHYLRRSSVGLSASTTYTTTFILQSKNDGTFFYFRDLDSVAITYIDVENREVVNLGASHVVKFLEEYEDSYRVSITFTTAGTITTDTLDYGISSSDSSITSVMAVGQGCYFWGCDITDLSFPTSYILNSGTGANDRKADVIVGSEASFNDDKGVFELEVAALSNDLTAREISISDTTEGERVFIGYDTTSNTFRGVIRATSNTVFTFDFPDITDLTNLKLMWDGSDSAFKVNYFEVDFSETTVTPVGLTTCDFHSGIGNAPFYGYVNELGTYNETSTYFNTFTTVLELFNEAKLNIG